MENVNPIPMPGALLNVMDDIPLLQAERRRSALLRLKSEQSRLETFWDWTNTAVRPAILAKCGFFYFHQLDRTQCAFCSGVIENWLATDDPAVEHARWFPRCPFVLNLPVGNIPLNESIVFPTPRPERVQTKDGTVAMNHAQYSNSNIPKYREMDNFNKRKESFKRFPVGIGLSIESLSNAGFFYEGNTDTVTCFQCNGQLRRWRKVMEPWVEHKSWFPECYFIKKMAHVNIGVGNPTSNFKCTWRKVEEDRDRMKDDQSIDTVVLCKICLSEKAEVAILPCGHVCTCKKCIKSIRDCPICRGKFEMLIPVYL